jgi:serine/threonine protein phosphatase PrpC
MSTATHLGIETGPVGVAVNQGRRDTLEDRHLVVRHEGRVLAGVFDGHGGVRAADLAVAHLAGPFWQALRDDRSPTEAFRDAFAAADAAILSRTCGTTATAFFLDEDRLTTANLGDSRIVLIGRTGVRVLTQDHRLSNTAERTRLRRRGASTRGVYVIRGGRRLMVTRALGDRWFRPVGIMAEPEVTTVRVPPDSVSVLAACDGVWDVLEPHEAGRIVRSAPTPQAAAQALIDAALIAGSQDNLTALVLGLQGWTRPRRPERK